MHIKRVFNFRIQLTNEIHEKNNIYIDKDMANKIVTIIITVFVSFINTGGCKLKG